MLPIGANDRRLLNSTTLLTGSAKLRSGQMSCECYGHI